MRAGHYTASVATRRPGLLTGEAKHQSLTKGLEIGTRFHSSPVVRLADAKPIHLGHAARADGRWRLYAFSDAQGVALNALCEHLAAHAPRDENADIDSEFDVRAILQQPHRSDIRINELPALLLPRKGQYGLIDYEQASFTNDAATDIFGERGIDRERGALVVVCPDQYVAHVCPECVR